MVVTLEEAKTFLRLDGNEEDGVVTRCGGNLSPYDCRKAVQGHITG